MEAGEFSSVLIDQVIDWLMESALRHTPIDALVEGAAMRVDAAGIPLLRFHMSFNILHPLYEGLSLTWRRGAGLEVLELDRTTRPENTAWQQSPFQYLIERKLPSLRRRLAGAEAVFDFSVLKTLREAGGTDYLAFVVPWGTSRYDGLAGSWVTDRPSGFSDSDLWALARLQRSLAVAGRMSIRGQVAENVVATYLGRDAGTRVLRGQMRRGDGEALPAVIWYSDLRDSTEMAATLPAADFIAVLNAYFEATAGAVLKQGGEILNFIGDAVLAIFPIAADADPAAVCGRALDAARDASQRLAAINDERAGGGRPPLAYGLALHRGDVVFGNIGTPERLAFSVIGPTVNAVARMEGLTKVVGRPLLVSAAFADALPLQWEPLGAHKVRGLAEPIAIFAPAQSAAPLVPPAAPPTLATALP